MAISVLAGAAWDLSGQPVFAFLPVGLALVPLLVLTPTLRFERR
jgi:hypothetical protein